MRTTSSTSQATRHIEGHVATAATAATAYGCSGSSALCTSGGMLSLLTPLMLAPEPVAVLASFVLQFRRQLCHEGLIVRVLDQDFLPQFESKHVSTKYAV